MIFGVIAASIIIAASIFLYISGDYFNKTANVNLSVSSYQSYVDPFNNSTSTPFSVNFSLNHYSGGPITFAPYFQVNSSITNQSLANSIWNLTTTTQNNSQSSPYWSVFYLNLMISPDRSNSHYGNFYYFQPQVGSVGLGHDVILWNQFSRDNVSVSTSPINLPSGSYNVSIMLKFQAGQPSQTMLNLTNGTAWVVLNSLQITSHTSFNGHISVSNVTVTKNS